jgi:Cation transporter/ATPase, N-terminus
MFGSGTGSFEAFEMTTATTARQSGENVPWYSRPTQNVIAQLGVEADDGLAAAEAQRRLAQCGPNELPTEAAAE